MKPGTNIAVPKREDHAVFPQLVDESLRIDVGRFERNDGCGFFILNGLLNIFWSYLFFNRHWLGAAVWEAGILDLSVIVLIILTITAPLLTVPMTKLLFFFFSVC